MTEPDVSENGLERNPVEVLAEEFARRYRAGENPSITEYAQRHPQHAEEIEDLFPAVTLLEDLKGLPCAPFVSCAKAEFVPERLGDFRIIREIGRGGMGVVFEAEQCSLARRVALKVLLAPSRLAPDQIERFRREAQAAARLHHTNIVPVFGVGEHEGLPYYVMQLIPGMGLDRILAQLRPRSNPTPSTEEPRHGVAGHFPPPSQSGPPLRDGSSTEEPRHGVAGHFPPPSQSGPPLRDGSSTEELRHGVASHFPPPSQSGPPLRGGSSTEESRHGVAGHFPPPSSPAYYRHVARLVAQAADALAHAHAQGILHRDIKPGNLLLDDKGAVWVADFGLAKHREQDDLTRPGDMAGTLRYSAPERFKGRSDARADVYSLGLTLYELLALRPAYDETDPARLLLQAMEGRIVRPRTHAPGIPRDLETIVLEALAPEPERRYQTADDLADDLRRFIDDRPVKARRTRVVEHLWRWCRRNPAVAALSLALLLASMLGFAGVTWKWREASAHLALAGKATREATNALEREEHQRERADEQRRRAEGNLDLALQAFERIAGQLALTRPDAPLDAGDEEAPHHPLASPEAAAVLQDLVRFYERFAATNSNDPRLKRDTARALRQVGAIRLRLGQYPQAVQALRRAADLLAVLPEPLDRARLHDELGVALRASGGFRDAAREHQIALEQLCTIKKPSAEERHEQARAHNLLGALQWRLQQPALAEQSQRAALDLLAKLVETKPKNPGCRHTQARAYHDLSLVLWPTDKRAEAMEARGKALETLESLANDFPGVPDYRAELAEILLAINPGRVRADFGLGPRPLTAWMYREVGRRFSRALELALELTAKHPTAPEYQSLLARARQRLGMVQLATGRGDDAVKNLRKSVALHRDLLKTFPNAPAFKPPAIEARLSLGEALRQQKKLAESEKVLRESLAEVRKLIPSGPRNRFGRTILIRHYRSLAQTLTQQGKRSEADEALRQAEELGKTQP